MMWRRRHLDVPDHGRRALLKWTVGLGAALGLRPWKVFEVNESLFGSAFAQAGGCLPANRFVCSVMGDGSFAWMTQLFPFSAQATTGGEAAFYAPGEASDQIVEPGDHPMKISPDAPRFGGKRMTGFLCGINEAHTRKPTSATRIETGVSMIASVASIQMASPSLVPSIAIGEMPYGSAAGAPMVASVPGSQGFVDLFGSAASSVGGSLSGAGDAALFEAAYKANIGLHRAAGRPTMLPGLRTAKAAAGLIASSFGEQLRPTADDLARYGVDGSQPETLRDIAKVLISTVKAFKLNLTSSVLVPGTNDDPHGAFDDPVALRARVVALGRMWDAFMSDLMAEPDPLCAGTRLGDNTILAWVGDTGKHPNVKTSWPDSTPRLANWMYVLGGGHLRSGWFGQVLAGDNAIETWNPTTGENLRGSSAEVAALSASASAAVLYAVARGDMRPVEQAYRGPSIAGVVKS